jgi:predicted ATPase
MKVVIIGKSGCGKSTLIEKLSDEKYPVIKEIARNVFSSSAYQGLSLSEKQLLIMYNQIFEEKTRGFFISDRGIHDNFVYSKRIGLDLGLFKLDFEKRYDYVFLLPPKKLFLDGVRVEKDDEEADKLQFEIETFYKETGHNIIQVPENFQLEFIKKHIEEVYSHK